MLARACWYYAATTRVHDQISARSDAASRYCPPKGLLPGSAIGQMHTFQPYITQSAGSTTALLEGGYVSDHHSDATELAGDARAARHTPAACCRLRCRLAGRTCEAGISSCSPWCPRRGSRCRTRATARLPACGLQLGHRPRLQRVGPKSDGRCRGHSRCLGTVWLCGKPGVDDSIFAELIGFYEHLCLPCSLCNTYSCATCAEANILPLAECTEGAGGLTGACQRCAPQRIFPPGCRPTAALRA